MSTCLQKCSASACDEKPGDSPKSSLGIHTLQSIRLVLEGAKACAYAHTTRTSGRMYVCVCARVFSTYECAYVRVHACMHVCIHVCMHV